MLFELVMKQIPRYKSICLNVLGGSLIDFPFYFELLFASLFWCIFLLVLCVLRLCPIKPFSIFFVSCFLVLIWILLLGSSIWTFLSCCF